MSARVAWTGAWNVAVEAAPTGDRYGDDTVTEAAAVVLEFDEVLVIEGTVEALVDLGQRIIAAARRSAAIADVRARLATVASDCGYDEDEDCPVDSLIDYKNAVEELAATALVQIAVAEQAAST